jgi:hypothetical protein
MTANAGADAGVFDPGLAGLTVTTRNGAGEEVLVCYGRH